MANTRKQKDDEEKIIKETIQKRFKSMFSGKHQPLSNMSIQEVEALKDRIFQLEKELSQESDTRQTAVIQEKNPQFPSSRSILQAHSDTLVKKQPSRLTNVLSNISMSWKMGFMVSIFLLAMIGITTATYVGLQSLRYHLSNIYDFMLIPIVAINNADTSLADAQYHIQALHHEEVTASELAQSLSDVKKDNSLAEGVISRYNNEWVTTSSPEFTQQLRDAGKLNLQHQEIEALDSFHLSFTGYKAAYEKYLVSVQAGQPDPNLEDDTIAKLQKARDSLQTLIDINNQFADISNVQAQAAYRQAFFTSILVFVISIIFGSFMSYLVVISITDRLSILTSSAAAMREGKLDQVVSIIGHDEVSMLGSTFNSMAAQLKNLFNNMELRVEERTHDLELATEVGRAVSEKVGNQTAMLSQAVELIRTRFDLYYAQIYLVDPSGKNIVLRAGTGDVGKELLRKEHHLPIHSSSLNGRAASEKHAVIVTDTKDNPTFLPNPLLPKTRSEVAIPLTVVGKVVGVLDMQSEEPGALNETNLPAFEALAGQLAIAIQNASLFEDASGARAEVETQIRRLTEQGWQDFLNAIERGQRIGYAFDQSQIVRLNSETLSGESTQAGLGIPITVTGTKIGEIQLPIEPGHAWTSDELELIKSTSAQLAQHVENLRLLAQAERYRNEAERAVRQLTHEGWNAHLQSNNELASGYRFDLNEVQTLSENGNHNSGEFIQPLTVRNETIGELALEEADQSPEAVEIVTAVAEQLSSHIENLRLLEQTEEQRAETNALYEIGQKISVAKDQQDIVAAVAENVGLPQINRAVLLSYEYNASGELETVTVTGNWHSGRGSLATPLGRQYPAKVFTIVNFFNGTEPGFVGDTQNDKRVDPASAAVFKAQNIHAFASLPLWDDTHQIGSLLLESEETISFTGKELLPYKSIMQQVGIAVENQVLFEQTQKRAKREQALREITSALRSSTNPATIMRTAVRELGSILGRRTLVQMAPAERTSQVASTVSNEDESSSSAN